MLGYIEGIDFDPTGLRIATIDGGGVLLINETDTSESLKSTRILGHNSCTQNETVDDI